MPAKRQARKNVLTRMWLAVLFLGYCTGNIAGPFFYSKEDDRTASPKVAR